ncbi:MAG TPA: GYF domain-containing protein [Polyangiaceae bacterium]|nr:GYF domain-containing protein [Polyangiaceae bacterium]
MKFLCPQCKAKYRIADEKLAERNSSRMKCRKCGHVIDIQSATVPDDSLPPPAVAPNDRASAPPPAPAPAPAVRKPGGAVPRTGGQAGPQPRRPAVGGAPAVRRPTASTATAVKRPVPPPRRGGAAVAAVAEKPAPIVDEQALATAPAATKPALTKPSADPVPTPPPDDAGFDRVSRPSGDIGLDRVSRPSGDVGLDRLSRPMPEATAAAPAAKNDFEEEPTRIHDGSSLAAAFSSVSGQAVAGASAPAQNDEWYIGIDGTPLGPVSLSVIREKAAERKATFESLVWREGFEEWKPLKHFPELVALVEEARRDLPADVHDLHTIPAPSPLDAQPAPKPRAASSEVPSELLEQIGASRPKGVSHPAAWTAVIVAVAFGVTIGSVLLSKTEKQEVVKYVEVPASAAPVTTASADPMVIEESTVSGGNTKKAVTSAQKAEPTAAPAKTGMPSLNGLNGLSNLGPTTQGPDVANNQALPGGQLDGNAIQRVVANFSSSVRRGCWDNALAARAPDAPSTARVAVTISISPSGSVDNVTTSGDPKGYPNLAHCIESKVRGWRFPRSGGSTTAQVPFVFAAQ